MENPRGWEVKLKNSHGGKDNFLESHCNDGPINVVENGNFFKAKLAHSTCQILPAVWTNNIRTVISGCACASLQCHVFIRCSQHSCGLLKSIYSKKDS